MAKIRTKLKLLYQKNLNWLILEQISANTVYFFLGHIVKEISIHSNNLLVSDEKKRSSGKCRERRTRAGEH